jgi:hypothetical protein
VPLENSEVYPRKGSVLSYFWLLVAPGIHPATNTQLLEAFTDLEIFPLETAAARVRRATINEMVFGFSVEVVR